MRQGPLAGRYPAVAAMVMFALIPYLALSAALGPLSPIIQSQLHISAQTFSLGGGLGNAAYATGTVLAVQFAQHFPQRRMMVGYAVLLVIGSVLEATAQNATMFVIGHILQGLCTSLLLIAAVPPLAIGFPQDKLRDTAVIMNICIFGAVALGPLIGGIQAGAHAWRPLFWIVTGVSVGALLLTILTFEDAPPANPDSPTDLPAIGLAAIGCVAAFFGASELTSHAFLSTWTVLPLVAGLLIIVILVIYQSLAKMPLLTIKLMLVSSIPVAGIIVALFAAAASVSATDLTLTVLEPHYSAVHIGLLYLPEVGGAIVTAVALGIVIKRRAVHYLPLFGMFALAAGIAVFRISVPSSQAMTLVGSGLTGIGLGATVAPALFVAGFSLPSANLQRVFAIVELFRAVAAFMIAPIFAHFAATAVHGNLIKGTGDALWIGLAIALGGAFLGVAIYWLSGARPQTPDLDAFLTSGTEPAWYSPPLLAKVRGLPPGTLAVPASAYAASASPVAPAATAAEAVPAAVGTNGGNGANGSHVGLSLKPTEGSLEAGSDGHGRVLIAYDGSELAELAIQQAGAQLQPGREALVLVVWQPANVGFHLLGHEHFDADVATEVHAAAEATATRGAEIAQRLGFDARPLTVEAAPTWKGIIEAADENDASLIVIGTHSHNGIAGHLAGSVASAVESHAQVPVLVVHQPD
jgi:nucleotide-binding universal stress UspA family protein/MFS family permease